MNFEKLRNYNTVAQALFFTISILGLTILIIISNWTSERSSRVENRVNELAENREGPEFFPPHPVLLDKNKNLFLLPQIAIPQNIKVDEDSITQFSVRSDEEENRTLLGHLAGDKRVADDLRIFDEKAGVFMNILPVGHLAHSVTLVRSKPGNLLCFLAREAKGLPYDELYVYSTSDGNLHRIGKPGYCPVALHLWENQSCWIVSMGKDLNKDGFINENSEPREWMRYDSKSFQLQQIK